MYMCVKMNSFFLSLFFSKWAHCILFLSVLSLIVWPTTPTAAFCAADREGASPTHVTSVRASVWRIALPAYWMTSEWRHISTHRPNTKFDLIKLLLVDLLFLLFIYYFARQRRACKRAIKPDFKCKTHGAYRVYNNYLQSLKNWCLLWATLAIIPLTIVLDILQVGLLYKCIYATYLPPFPIHIIGSLKPRCVHYQFAWG